MWRDRSCSLPVTDPFALADRKNDETGERTGKGFNEKGDENEQQQRQKRNNNSKQ
jgi:hypothetical protein